MKLLFALLMICLAAFATAVPQRGFGGEGFRGGYGGGRGFGGEGFRGGGFGGGRGFGGEGFRGGYGR